MYQLGNIEFRLEQVAIVFPVQLLLGYNDIHGFDVLIAGYRHTAKYPTAEAATQARTALLDALNGTGQRQARPTLARLGAKSAH